MSVDQSMANDLVEAIRTFREAAYGDSNDAEIEAGQDVADLAVNLLNTLGVDTSRCDPDEPEDN